jgi:hypothetical protein
MGDEERRRHAMPVTVNAEQRARKGEPQQQSPKPLT